MNIRTYSQVAATILVASCAKTGFNSNTGTPRDGQQHVRYAGTDVQVDPTPDPSASSSVDPSASESVDPSATPTTDPAATPTPSPCVTSETPRFAETTGQIVAKFGDLWAARQAGFNGGAPVQIFKNQTLQANDKLYFVSATGKSIFRIYNAEVQSIACDATIQAGYKHAWFVYFKDAAGNNLDTSGGKFGQLHDYDAGVMIPAGAVSAWIGFRDDISGYDDNEGNRTAPYGSTRGCTFSFKVTSANLCE